MITPFLIAAAEPQRSAAVFVSAAEKFGHSPKTRHNFSFVRIVVKYQKNVKEKIYVG